MYTLQDMFNLENVHCTWSKGKETAGFDVRSSKLFLYAQSIYMYMYVNKYICLYM